MKTYEINLIILHLRLRLIEGEFGPRRPIDLDALPVVLHHVGYLAEEHQVIVPAEEDLDGRMLP
jgi:hypothetical protein